MFNFFRKKNKKSYEVVGKIYKPEIKMYFGVYLNEYWVPESLSNVVLDSIWENANDFLVCYIYLKLKPNCFENTELRQSTEEEMKKGVIWSTGEELKKWREERSKNLLGVERVVGVDGGIEHIVFGEFNDATGLYTGGGLHSRQIFDKMASNRVIEYRNMTSPDSFGVVEVEIKKKTGDWIDSTKSLFPPDWNEIKIMDEIAIAYGNKVFDNGNTYIGNATTGMEIRMYIDPDTDKIISAFPKKQ